MEACCDTPTHNHTPCPDCGQQGQSVTTLTPQHTLKAPFRREIEPLGRYYFCENSHCNIVYFSEDGHERFGSEQLINCVTCKDPSPETPLCYCYKITKGDVLAEYRATGESRVLQQIASRMAAKACFCDRSNPRGLCCTTEIKQWLQEQGIKTTQEAATAPCADSCCE